MSTMAHAAPSGKVRIAGNECSPTCTGNYAERQRRLAQLRELERIASTLDERKSWHHAVRKIERAIAPTTRARCASPASRAHVSRAGGRRAPRAPRQVAAARAAPPGDDGDGDGDGDPDASGSAARGSAAGRRCGHES